MKTRPLFAAVMASALLFTGCNGNDENASLDEAKVTLGEYKGIAVSVKKTEVTDEDVKTNAGQLVSYYNMNAKSSRTTARDGDTVYASVAMYDESGKLLDDTSGNSEGFITIGSGGTHKELEQGLIGAKVGEERTIAVTLPDPYEYDKSLSGAKITCKATIQYIQDEHQLLLDSLTDGQADKILAENNAEGYKGVDGFYQYVRDTAQKQADDALETETYNAISEKLLETCTIDPFPGAELKKRMDGYMDQAEDMCKNYYGTSLDEYCKQIGTTRDGYYKDAEASVSETLKLELIFTAIADKEGIQYDENAFDDYVNEAVTASGYESKEALYEEYGEEYLKRAFRVEYVVDWLIANADIVYTEPAPDDASSTEPDHK